MLQRSWTVEQEEAVGDAGAVYVGRASFRMGGTPTQASLAVGAGDRQDADEDDFFAPEPEGAPSGLRELPVVLPHVPTDRIVLGPGSPPRDASAPADGASHDDAVVARRSVLVSFGGAFLVGVVCTMAGQVALHWRARHLGAQALVEGAATQVGAGSSDEGATIAAAPASATATPVAGAAPAAGAPGTSPSVSTLGPRRGTTAEQAPAAVVAPTPAPSLDGVRAPPELPVARPDGIGVSEARVHSRASRHSGTTTTAEAKNGKNGKNGQDGQKGQNGQDGQNGSQDAGGPRRAGGEAVAERGRFDWVDPFAADEDADAAPASRGAGVAVAPPADRARPLGERGALGERGPSARARSSNASAPTEPRWVDPFAQ